MFAPCFKTYTESLFFNRGSLFSHAVVFACMRLVNRCAIMRACDIIPIYAYDIRIGKSNIFLGYAYD